MRGERIRPGCVHCDHTDDSAPDAVHQRVPAIHRHAGWIPGGRPGVLRYLSGCRRLYINEVLLRLLQFAHVKRDAVLGIGSVLARMVLVDERQIHGSTDNRLDLLAQLAQLGTLPLVGGVTCSARRWPSVSGGSSM